MRNWYIDSEKGWVNMGDLRLGEIRVVEKNFKDSKMLVKANRVQTRVSLKHSLRELYVYLLETKSLKPVGNESEIYIEGFLNKNYEIVELFVAECSLKDFFSMADEHGIPIREMTFCEKYSTIKKFYTLYLLLETQVKSLYGGGNSGE